VAEQVAGLMSGGFVLVPALAGGDRVQVDDVLSAPAGQGQQPGAEAAGRARTVTGNEREV
jgi:hypothetical protein